MNFIRCSLCFTDSKLMVLNAKQKLVVQKLLSIELEHKENEPDLICDTCYTVLSEFNQFRKRIRRLRNVQESVVGSSTVGSSTVEDTNGVTSSSSSKEVSGEPVAKKKKRSSMTGHDTSNVNSLPSAVSNTDSAPSDALSEETPEETEYVDSRRNPRPSNVSNDNREGDESSADLQEKRKRNNVPNDVREVARTIRSQLNVTKEQRICSICFTICDSMKHLIQHRRTVHPEAMQFECTEPNCSEVFADHAERAAHKIQKHPQCRTCHAKFDGPNALKRHRCRLKKFKCPKECGERFETEELLRKHFKRCRPGANVYCCSFCKKELSCSRSLKEHIKICIHTKAPRADRTSNTSASEPAEDALPATNTINVSFSCTKCHKEFSSVSALGTHFSTCDAVDARSVNSTPRRTEAPRRHDERHSVSSVKQESVRNSADFEVKIKEEKTEIIDLLAADSEPADVNTTAKTTVASTAINRETGVVHRFFTNDPPPQHSGTSAKGPGPGPAKYYKPRSKNAKADGRSWPIRRGGASNRQKDPVWNGRGYREDRNPKSDRRLDSWNLSRERY